MSGSVTLTDAEISALESPINTPQHFEVTDTVVFSNCKTGLGIKIVGGTSEDLADSDFGIFVKRVIPGGLAAESGRLREGDQILSVNSENLYKVSNERAVQLLRSASASNHVTLVLSRGPQTLRKFKVLLENQLARRSGRSSGSSQTGTSTGSNGQRIAYPGMSSREGSQASSPTSSMGSTTSASMDHSDDEGKRVHQIIVSKVAGLGLQLYGGSDSPDGPGVFIERVLPGGDCNLDGRVRAHDQLVAINDHNFDGLTQREATAIITRISLRPDLNSVTVSYIPSTRTPVNKDRNHTPSSHPSGGSHTLSSTQLSPHPHSHHSSPQPIGRFRPDSPGQRSLPQPPISHSPHNMNSYSHVPQDRMQGHSPMAQSNIPQQSMGASHLSDATMMGRGVLPERRSPAAGEPAPSPSIMQLEMNPYTQGGHPHMAPPTAIPPHLQRGGYMEPKMTSTPEGATINGFPPRASSVPLPPGGDPSPVLPPYNHSHYTSQPMGHAHLSPSPSPSPVPSSYISSPAHSPTPMSHSRRLSIDPQIRLKIDKLQVALEYLGICPTPAENRELVRRLSMDNQGMVSYGDFVAVARQLFKLKLDDSNVGSGVMSHGAYDVTDFAEPPPFQPQVPTPPPVLPPPPVAPPIQLPFAELEILRREKDDARNEAEKLKFILQEKERSFRSVEEQLSRIRKQAQSAIDESQALRSRVHLAEAAQQEARNMELDYEVVVMMLEDELKKLRRKLKKIPQQMAPAPQPQPEGPGVRELQNRLAVMGCELRKLEASKKTYEVSTEKLLHFAEMVHEHLTEGPNGTLRNKGENARRGTNGFRPPGYLGKHKGPINLAAEARDSVKAVKALVESEPLPHGWEEAYTADGTKYFLNHVTQCTTWIHPSSGVNHLPSLPEREDLPETRA